MIPALAIYALQQHKVSYLPMRRTITCLICLCFFQWGCAQFATVEKNAAARQIADSGCDIPGCMPSTGVRVPKAPPAAPQGLPIPTFSPQTGTVAFGTKINLSVSTLPTGAVIEYSYDNGKTWLPGNKVAVVGTEPILSRTRINDLTSNPAQATFRPFYQRMLVIGNSIMNHGPLPAQGWFNTNGMAASAPDKDFVHVLTAHLAQQCPEVAFRLVSGGNFERHFSQQEYSFDEFKEPLQQFKPDLIVVRLGENVDEGNVFSPIGFEAQFRRLLERLATYSGQPVRIVCTTSVWKRPQADAIIRRVTSEKGIPLADLSNMVGQDQYFAIGQYTSASVAAHPNDAGMKRIADLIWQKLP
ncbi:hypothetical protein GCM10027423_27110 [Spirosoma arcticum]